MALPSPLHAAPAQEPRPDADVRRCVYVRIVPGVASYRVMRRGVHQGKVTRLGANRWDARLLVDARVIGLGRTRDAAVDDAYRHVGDAYER